MSSCCMATDMDEHGQGHGRVYSMNMDTGHGHGHQTKGNKPHYGACTGALIVKIEHIFIFY